MSVGAGIRSYTVASMQSEAPTSLQRAWRLVLAVAAAGYRAGLAVRAGAFAAKVRPIRQLACPVICVGNLTVGGSGKTPCTIALAQWLRDRGWRVGILLRGYARRSSGMVIAADEQGIRGRWEAVGDEAVLLARRLPGIPVIVGGNRFRAGREALRQFRPDVLLLDDGFQHRQLYRNLDLVMIDATDPLGGGWLLPRGRLREPVGGLRRAHAVILSRTDQAPDVAHLQRWLAQIAPGATQVLTRHRPSRLSDLAEDQERPLASLAGRRLFAVSGIANPRAFQRTLTDLGGVLVGALAFPDHHPYGPTDWVRLHRAALEADAELIVITEKDAVRMSPPEGAGTPCRPILVLQVDLEVIEGMALLEGLLLRCVGGQGG